jgi:CRP/FNR family cyclic AMP-dependent transcriptional regulator
MWAEIFSRSGWLAAQPTGFRSAVLRACTVIALPPGTPVYRQGDLPDGIYGVAHGLVALALGSEGAIPRIAQLITPGGWFGGDTLITGEARRLSAFAWVETSLLHLPLPEVERLSRGDADNIRRFSQVAIQSLDMAHRAIGDLMIPTPHRRIAAALARLAEAAGPRPLPLTQQELGVMANASRKLVNQSLSHFAAEGWVHVGYRQIAVRDDRALRAYAEDESGARVASGCDGARPRPGPCGIR